MIFFHSAVKYTSSKRKSQQPGATVDGKGYIITAASFGWDVQCVLPQHKKTRHWWPLDEGGHITRITGTQKKHLWQCHERLLHWKTQHPAGVPFLSWFCQARRKCKAGRWVFRNRSMRVGRRKQRATFLPDKRDSRAGYSCKWYVFVKSTERNLLPLSNENRAKHHC